MRKVPAFLEVVAFAMVVALTNAKNMITILMFSFTLRAGGTFFPYVLGHFWKRAGSAGSIASIILGSLTVVLVEPDIVSLFGLQPIVPGLLCGLFSLVLFSHLFSNRKAREL